MSLSNKDMTYVTKDTFPFCTIGIDLGATKIASGLLYYEKEGLSPVVVNTERVLTEGFKGRDTILANIFKSVQKNIDFHENSNYSEVRIIGVGVGATGHINRITGCVDLATNTLVDWTGTPLVDSLIDRFKIDAYAIGDVQAHCLGEVKWGSAMNAESVLMVAAGTGVGGAIFFMDRLFAGVNGYAGEIGHTLCQGAEGKLCSCGETGHLESIASGWGIENCYKEESGKEISGTEISDRAKNGEELAIKIVKQAGRALGSSIASMASFLNVEMVVIGGSVANSSSIWDDEFYQAFKNTFPKSINQPMIKKPKLGNLAPIVGASEALLFNRRWTKLEGSGIV